MLKTTRRHPVASSKGGCRRSQPSPPSGRISSRAVHGRPEEPGQYDVVTTVPRPGAIDKCGIASVNRLLMALSSQLDRPRHEDKWSGCVRIVRLGWKAGIEIVRLSPQEMNASIAKAHQFNGCLGSSVVNLWPYFSGPPRVSRHRCTSTRASAFGNTLRTATVSGQSCSQRVRVVKGEGPRE